MKKQILNFESNALSRKEMKSLNGGYFGCKTGPCSVVFMKGSNFAGSRSGLCQVYASSGGQTGCFCDIGNGPGGISSNGGVSHCTV